tara:strand:- start:798 stop:1154 length:357 start_codon:yes stop_codon:yes gene_type:complete
MSEEKPEEVIVKKLDKVADSLETTTSQLSSVVTQQQLDLIRERVSKCESDLSKMIDSIESNHTLCTDRIEKLTVQTEKIEEQHNTLERDHSSLRALIYSSFVLSTISVVGIVIFAMQL